jgi:serine kinase of HPr protein (carbohydrate metabolism regulator)
MPERTSMLALRTPDPGSVAAARHCVQATCVAVEGCGVLLRGPSGSGKSDLALRLIDGGGRLVSDDLTELVSTGRDAIEARFPATAPAELRGVLEVRGLGLLPVPSIPAAPLRLVVDLGEPAERLPEPAFSTYLGVDVPRICVDPFTASAAAKIRLAARCLPGVLKPCP